MTQQPQAQDRGKEVEELVNKICERMFLPDLVVANPKFKKGGKLEKEVADVIIPYHNSLICFQIKSKTELKSASQKTESDIERIERRVDEGIGQLKTIRACLKRNLISALENRRGIALPIDCSQITTLYGIVILELLGEENFPEEERTNVLSGFTMRDGMPIHIFKKAVFDEVSTEIDTIPDFLDYLDVRQKLIGNGHLNPFTEELDFLAIYKSKQNIIDQLRRGEVDFLVIDDGVWKAYKELHKEAIEQRNKANETSYLWDEVIKSLHSSIGFKPEFEIEGARHDIPPGSVESYLAATLEFSTLRRVVRRVVGRKLMDVMARADRNGQAHSFIASADGKGLNIVIFASGAPRKERADDLFKICSVIYCGMGLSKIVGIATEPLSHEERSNDFILLDGVGFSNADELREQFAKFNVAARQQHVTEKEYGSFEE